MSDSSVHVWYRATPKAEGAARDAAAALAGAGVIATPAGDDVPGGAGLLFLDTVGDAACDQVRVLSRNRLERLLVVAVSPQRLTHDQAWRLLRSGASDVLGWADDHRTPREVAARLARWERVDTLVASPLVARNVIGGSPVWVDLLRQVVEVAAFADATVLLAGESGTGKELLARLIHALDRRSVKRDLVVLDCTTVVPELAGSEFFGHERGSFTGATAARDGAFSLADQGTLFLDEVGELRPAMQAQLLRVIQEGTYKRVGGNRWNETRFRLVCATNRDLSAEIAGGRFRADLYYRIAAVTIAVPPLRDRPDDILPLFRHFVEELRPGEEPPELDGAVLEHLLRRDYPGNVRDLKQLATRICYRHVGPGPITVGDLPEDEWATAPGDDPRGDRDGWRDSAFETAIRRALTQGHGLKDIGRLASEVAIEIAVGDASGNLQQAAERLGVTDRALQMRRASRRRRWGGSGPAASSRKAAGDSPP